MIERKLWEPGFQAVPNYVINGLPNTRLQDYDSMYLRASFLAMYTDCLVGHLRDITGGKEYIPSQALIRGDDFNFCGRSIGGMSLWAWQEREDDQPLTSVIGSFSQHDWFDNTYPVGLIAIDVTQPLSGCPEELSDSHFFMDQESYTVASKRQWGEIKRYKTGIFVYELNRKSVRITGGELRYHSDTKGVEVDLEIE